jgi:hypothetical protein
MHVNNNLICILLQPHACMHACIDYSRVRARQWHVSFPFRYNSHGRRFSQCTLIHIKRQAGRHHTRVLDRNHPDFLAACLLACSSRAAFALSRRHAYTATLFLSLSWARPRAKRHFGALQSWRCILLNIALCFSQASVRSCSQSYCGCLSCSNRCFSCWSIGSFLRSSMLFERKTRWRAAQCCLSSATLAWPASVHDEIDCVVWVTQSTWQLTLAGKSDQRDLLHAACN